MHSKRAPHEPYSAAKESLISVRDILWTAIKAYGDDHAPQLAAAIAYHALFALAPLAVAVIAIGGLVFGSETMMQEATRFVGNAFGASSAETLKSIIASASAVPTTNVWATAGGGVLVLVGSARAFMQLQNGLNVVWGVRIRSRTSWYRVVLLRMLPFTLIVAGALIVAGVVIADALLGWALDAGIVASGIPGLGGYVRSAVWVLGSLAVIAYAYKVLPDARIRWQEVWLGSAITTALLALATLGFREYVARIGVGSALGVAGTPVVLIMWVYLASQIVLFGAEITQVVAHRRGQPIVPTSYAISVGEANDRV